MRRTTRYGRSRRRVVTRRRTKRPVIRRPLKKAVKRIARWELMKDAETKRVLTLNESYNLYLTGAGNLRSYNMVNIFGIVAQGVTQNSLVGDSFNDPMFVAKMQFTVNWNAVAANLVPATNVAPSICLRAWIIACNDQYTNTISPIPVGSTSTTVDWFLQDRAFRARMNSDACTVVRSWSRVVSPPDIQFGTPVAPNGLYTYRHAMKKKWKGKKSFEPFSPTQPNQISAYLKGQNYYFVVGWGLPDGTFSLANPVANNPVQIYCDRYLYFKDP